MNTGGSTSTRTGAWWKLALKLDLKNAHSYETEQKIGLLIGNLRLTENVADSGNADVDTILNYKAMQAQVFGNRQHRQPVQADTEGTCFYSKCH